MNRNINLHLLHASGSLASVSKLIADQFAKSIDRISQKLPISDVDVVVYNNPRGVIPEYGIGGFTSHAHLVFVSLDLKRPNLEAVIKNELIKTLSHELHHCMRWRNPGYGKTLLEELVSEGLACHFEIEVCQGEPSLYCKILNKGELIKYMGKAEESFYDREFSHKAWFFGSKEEEIPKWTGYSLGFKLVGNYLKMNPDKKVSELYATKAGEFVKERI